MMLRLALAVLVVLPAMANAQGPALSSRVTTGWTSNAEGDTGGTGDIFIEQNHAIALAHEEAGLSLRGTLSLDEARYGRLWQENDRRIGSDLAAQWQLSQETLARANLALAWHEDGQAIPGGAGAIAAATPFLKGNIGVELETRLGDTLVVAGLSHAALTHSETTFSSQLLPVRTRADANVLGADFQLTHALNETIAISALARGLYQSIPDADQMLHGRVPSRVVRLGAGIKANIPLRAAFDLEAGGDIVWSDRQGIGTSILPYARSQLTLALGKGFDLTTSLRTSLDLETPADGYADWVIDGRAGIGHAISASTRLEAAIFASATRSIGFDIEHKRKLGGVVSAQAAFGDGFTARAGLMHVHHAGLAPAFDETRMELTLAAAL